ncbi:MAG: Dabb family protein [Lachnospiraceae bacterium]|nr:Dabb family protein [Lachnospiraceae bacterium]MDY5742934.1 Dabb family protein [Lachnospiraceae bacterium]
MIKHIVMFKFKEQAEGRSRSENVAMTKAMLDALPAQIPQITSSLTETGCAHADTGNYDLILTSTFQTIEDLADYIVHPAHQAVGAFMRPLRENRACIDIEV